MEHSIFDEVDPEADNTGARLLESYQYWQRRRLLFNIVVGLAGLGALFFSKFNLELIYLLAILIWGITANIFYSTGYMLESFVIVKSAGSKNLKTSREFLFWTGTLLYAVISVLLCSE